MRVWFVVMAFALAGIGCQCVKAPDVRYACERDEDCDLPRERCVGRLCEELVDAGVSDAGVRDGGTDAGPSDAGGLDASVDAGFDAGLREADCGNALDDDGDTLFDCVDPDCDGQLCRAAAFQCDAPEVCRANVCPADGVKDAGTSCEDGTACTANDTCAPDGGCEGGAVGPSLFRCTLPGQIEIIGRGGRPPATSFCNGTEPDAGPLARELPNAITSVFLPILSPVGPDGGCFEFFPDGGLAAVTARVCDDWLVSPSQAGYCQTNTVSIVARTTPFDGGVPVFQNVHASPPLHSFSTTASSLTEPPGAPLFYACPP